MDFTRKEPYLKQIMLYVQNQEFERAYALAQDFIGKFQKEVTAYFLLSKVAFRLKKFPEATQAARTAFNLATTKQDMISCAVVLSAGYYMQGNNDDAYKVLHQVGGDGNSDVERLMFLFALSVQNEAEAVQHLDRLYQINRRMAEDFIQRFF